MALSDKVYHVSGVLAAQDGETSVVTPSVLTASTNDWSLIPSSGDSTLFHVQASAAIDVTGIVAPAAVKCILLYNKGAFTVTLKHQNAGSAAANRIVGLGSADYALTAGGYAVLVYDVGASRWVVSQEVPRSGFKIGVDGTDGAIVVLDRRFWSCRNSGYDTTDTANSEELFYRYGLVVPTASYLANSAATRESLPIDVGSDEVIKPPRGTNGVFLLADSGTLVALFRPNESGQGFNR